MNPHKTAGLAGLAFALATVVGFSLQPSIDFDAPAATFAAQLAAGKSGLLASGIAMAVAAVALHWFLSSLGAAHEGPAAAVLAPAGAAAAALLALGFLGVAALASAGGDPAALQATARLANTATNVALLPLAGAGLAVAALKLHPVWIAGLGVVAAAASIFAAGRASDELGFLALLLWLVWSLGLSVSLLRSVPAHERRHHRGGRGRPRHHAEPS